MKQSKPKVLVVDDEDYVRTLITEMLDGYYTVVEACNGAEAVEMAVQDTPDVIIMDLFMPVMDGCTACFKIKQLLAEPIPFIAITGKGGQMQESLMLSIGATRYLAKPFNQEELLSAVKSVVSV